MYETCIVWRPMGMFSILKYPLASDDVTNVGLVFKMSIVAPGNGVSSSASNTLPLIDVYFCEKQRTIVNRLRHRTKSIFILFGFERIIFVKLVKNVELIKL